MPQNNCPKFGFILVLYKTQFLVVFTHPQVLRRNLQPVAHVQEVRQAVLLQQQVHSNPSLTRSIQQILQDQQVRQQVHNHCNQLKTKAWLKLIITSALRWEWATLGISEGSFFCTATVKFVSVWVNMWNHIQNTEQIHSSRHMQWKSPNSTSHKLFIKKKQSIWVKGHICVIYKPHTPQHFNKLNAN